MKQYTTHLHRLRYQTTNEIHEAEVFVAVGNQSSFS